MTDISCVSAYSVETALQLHRERRSRMAGKAVADDGIRTPSEWRQRIRDRNITEYQAKKAALAAAATNDKPPVWPEVIPPSNRCGSIVRMVARHFGLSPAEITGRSRFHRLTFPRHIAMYLVREAGFSFADAGRRLGGFDHSTVLYAFRKIARMKAADTELAVLLNAFSAEAKCQTK